MLEDRDLKVSQTKSYLFEKSYIFDLTRTKSKMLLIK